LHEASLAVIRRMFGSVRLANDLGLRFVRRSSVGQSRQEYKMN
jgi:hypothetical protein